MTILITLHALITLALIVVVLMQKRNTGALGGLAGQSNPSRMATSRSSSNPLAKLTTWLAAIFIGMSLLLAYLSKSAQVDPAEALARAVSQTSAPVMESSPPVLPGPASQAKPAPISPLKPDIEGGDVSSAPAQKPTAPSQTTPSVPQPSVP